MNKAEQIMTLALIRQIELQRVSTWMLQQLLPELDDIGNKIAIKVMEVDPFAVNRAVYQRQRLTNLQAEVDQLIFEVLRELAMRTEDYFKEINEISEEENRRNWFLIYGAGITIADASKIPEIMGVPVVDHFNKIANDLNFRTAISLRDAHQGAGNSAEMAERARQIARLPASPIEQAKRSVEVTIRTGVDDIPTDVEVRSEPKSEIDPHGWQHISVLDSKTSDICRGRAWKIWDEEKKPVGHSLPFSSPPLHPYCRSRLIMVFLNQPTVAPLTFPQFVGSLPEATAARLFGSANLKLWKQGKLTNSQLIRQQGRPMTIEALSERTNSKNEQSEFPYL